MQRWFLAGCSAFLFAAVVAGARGDDAAPQAPLQHDENASTYAGLIARLSDPDPAVRAESREQLINLGEGPRPALRKALAAADPQTRSEINRILLHIRWTGFGDSDKVESAFMNYSEEDAETRCGQIDTWLAPPQTGGGTALLRILVADPSPAVRWEAAAALSKMLLENDPLTRQVFDYASGIDLPRDAYLPADQNAPLLAIGGWSVRVHKPDLAVELMRKAMVIESEHPSAYRGQLHFVTDYLARRAAVRKDYAQVAQLLREQAERSAWNPASVPEPVAQLFAVHADFGPLPGRAGDLSTYKEYLAHPEMVYAISRMLQHRHQDLPAALFNTLALVLGGTSAEAHYLTGQLLVERGWTEAAERELLWSLSLSNGKLFSAYIELSSMAEQQDDDLSAAKYLERGMDSMKKSGLLTQLEVAEQYAAQIEWHYIRGYRLAHDRAALEAHMEKFMQLNQTTLLLERDPEMAADIVPALQELGRTDQADRIFDNAYEKILGEINGTPADPMPKNNLAWLCACSGKKLDEAVKYSDEAVAMVPDDAACLDTQAEAYFRSGHAQHAAEIETRALEIKPGDRYMQRQLNRFRAAAK